MEEQSNPETDEPPQYLPSTSDSRKWISDIRGLDRLAGNKGLPCLHSLNSIDNTFLFILSAIVVLFLVLSLFDQNLFIVITTQRTIDQILKLLFIKKALF